MKYNLKKIVIMVVVAELVGVLGSVFTAPAIAGWYAALNKPFFTPPGWLFAPVWVTLFLLMGIAAGIVWNSKSKLKRIALRVYYGQLVLNLAWSMLFFGARAPAAAFAEIVLLWVAILYTILIFRKVDIKAAYLMVPYICWVTIASALNLGIVLLN
jgi:benzodiazapine receptor